jgi:hypothetical protein
MDYQAGNMIKEQLKEVLISKMEELHMLGYDGVTEEDLWECVTSKYKKGMPIMSQVVNDIFRLKPNDMMNWLTLNAYKGKLLSLTVGEQKKLEMPYK